MASSSIQAYQVDLPRREVRPLTYWDVYVDDFIGLAQGSTHSRRRVKRALFHALDLIFRPLDEEDDEYRQEPASVKKLRKGDGTWSTIKTILGWIIDTLAMTIQLPPHRLERLNEILNGIAPTQRRTSINNWHRIVGELRSMTLAIPGARGLFSTLQEAFRHKEVSTARLRLSKHAHAFLDDFRWLANDIALRPTRIHEVIASWIPATLGACDAAGQGMGGVHFIPQADGTIIPLLWRCRFPQKVRDDLVSVQNPRGNITNSDLELAGSVAQHDVLAHHADVRERTTHNERPTMTLLGR